MDVVFSIDSNVVVSNDTTARQYPKSAKANAYTNRAARERLVDGAKKSAFMRIKRHPIMDTEAVAALESRKASLDAFVKIKPDVFDDEDIFSASLSLSLCVCVCVFLSHSLSLSPRKDSSTNEVVDTKQKEDKKNTPRRKDKINCANKSSPVYECATNVELLLCTSARGNRATSVSSSLPEQSAERFPGNGEIFHVAKRQRYAFFLEYEFVVFPFSSCSSFLSYLIILKIC